MTFYPGVDDVLAVHHRLISQCGSPNSEVRLAFGTAEDLNRHWPDRNPVTYVDLIQEAAALWESLSQNHPFVDGNKRVAVTVTAAFLKVNGYRLEFDPSISGWRNVVDGGMIRRKGRGWGWRQVG